MNIEIAKKGHSFKGAFAYYLHDKGAQTAERVAWTETRNFALDDPAYAQSVMIATARQADALKKAAGVKATGRKATAGPVYAFSLSWHPDEAGELDRAEMVRAADAALKVLKADHLQTVIVCHQDRAHPHVHVIVNRVHPDNGIMEGFSKDRDKLDVWADQYERERGLIVSRNRARKYDEQRRAAGQGLQATFAKVAPPLKPKSPAALLAERQAAQKVRHKQEWAELSAANAARRDAIKAERIDFKAIAAAHRAENKPLWSRLGKDLAAERRAFLKREERIGGIIRNAIDIVRGQQITGRDGDRGFLTMCFNYMVSAPLRRAALDTRQQEARAELAGRLDAALIAKFDAAKASKAEKFTQARATYEADRAALMERQGHERESIREGWRQIYADRERTGYKPRPAWARGDSNQARGGSTSRTSPQDRARHLARQDFRQGERLAPANQSDPQDDRDAQWKRLEELGQKSRGQGVARYRGRGLHRE
jgi:hypothetical protein